MTKHKDVGRSWRTPIKHDYLSSIVGQEAGVISFIGARHGIWYDLTAGDAAPVDGEDWHRACSPGILAYHAAGCRAPIHIRLHEIQTGTYDRLVGNLSEQLPALGYAADGPATWTHPGGATVTALNVSGAHADVSDVDRNAGVFVVNDPNAITEWAMRPTFASEIAARTGLFRCLSTMGCNPAGIKRLAITERINWFAAVREQQRALPAYRDLSLAALDRDEAQWAYLVATSAKPRWRSGTDQAARRSAKNCNRSVSLAWWRQDSDEFTGLLLRLFLQKSELKQIRGREREWMAASNEQRLAMIPCPAASNPDALPDVGEDLALFDVDDA
ncbi:hypothetical protein BJF79_13500 [Actinomadura sp. CNU-125]|uniref:hypothetical protein n=1 Tax=Actinomadura sp. CNU-125 TaxID=1904961 RepID=UPI000967DA01|nr:hypothetical protein [Actinomadura sp. CNU-125]OLT24354.1 hypothetical protein BJF79_13500 [Actinomadura sp. CNU-125]